MKHKVTDSTLMLEAAGLRPLNATTFDSQRWRVERGQDPDYPWTLTDRVEGSRRPCSSLIECVQVVYGAEGLDLALFR